MTAVTCGRPSSCDNPRSSVRGETPGRRDVDVALASRSPRLLYAKGGSTMRNQLFLIGCLFGCGASQPPVPVVGGEADIARLAGQWLGEYSSAETGRSGSIVFTLTSGSDTATGDVVMTPRLRGVGPTSPNNQAPPSPAASAS